MANNQSVRRHLDAFTRGRIIGKLEKGRTVTRVAAEFGIAHSIARRNRRQTAGEIARHTTRRLDDRYRVLPWPEDCTGGGLFARRPVRCVPLTLPIGEGVLCRAGNTGIGETMNGDEYSLQMRADSV
ncbi:hypothetical protein TNCV_2646991 [Trichonephila clavipes]|nr:hypothetical protein TNCV_2646991 [Trichonephila clavipes]